MRGELTGVVTLYNRWLDSGTERWQRTVLEQVAVEDCRGEAIRHGGAAATSARRIGPVTVGEIMVLIPQAGREGYTEPADWEQCQNRAGRWALCPGDLLLPGRCEDEAEDGIGKLIQSGRRVGIITTVADRGTGTKLAHWEVLAR